MPDIRPAYLEKVDQYGDLTVCIVDGSYIRGNLGREFTNFGHHYTFKFIPENELWIDKEAAPDERDFFIAHLLIEHRLMARGAPYEKALDIAGKVERRKRRRAGDLKRLTKNGKKLPDPHDVKLRLWKKLENGVSVWVVDGRLVRSAFYIDFTAGGHDCVYEFVPDNEIWIDNDIDEDERPYVLLHELHERNLMAKGWTYPKAHVDSSRLEYRCRKCPDEVHDCLNKEGWG